MIRVSLPILVLIQAAVPQVHALNPAEDPANYIVSQWDTESGLPHNAIKQLFQTRDGYLWIGTGYGLARFDGLAFTVFTPSNTPAMLNGQITALAQTADDSLWIGTSDGLVRYQDGRFTTYTIDHGLRSRTINALCIAPDGSLWIGGREGITRWVNGSFVNDIDTSAYDTFGLRTISATGGNTLWIATGPEVLRYRDGAFTRFGAEEGITSERVEKVRQEADGTVLAITQSGLLELVGDRFAPSPLSPKLSNEQVSTAELDRDGNLWVGSVGGLDRIHGSEVTPYLPSRGQMLGVVDAILEDRESCLWLGTSTGLYRFTNRRASSLSQDDGITGNLITSIRQTRDGSLWVASWAGGVDRLRDGDVAHYTVGAPLSHETVTLIYEAPDGTMWLGNRGSSIDRLDGNSVTTYVFASGVASSRPVTAALMDDDGVLMLGIDKRGLLELRDEQIVAAPRVDDWPETGETVFTFRRTLDERFLMGTSRGLHERGPGRVWRRIELSGLTGPVIVRHIHEEPDGALWLSTAGHGLVRWQDGRAQSFGTRQGMIDDTLFGMVDDGAGSFWVSSARGIARIRKTEFAEFDEGTTSTVNSMTFGRVDGLLSSATPGSGTPALCRMSDGRLLFATDQGVAVIDPAALQTNDQPPTVVVEALLADGEPVELGDGAIVPAGVNRLEFHYTALSLVAPERLRFRYQLEGSDRTWTEAGSQRTASYTHLSPGRYTFRLLASNNDGVWSQSGESLSIRVLPHFYQTAWFGGLMVVMIGGAGYGTYRARQRRSREQMAMLTTLVQERTRELQSAKESAEAAVIALKEAEAERAKLHRQLLETSRQAGMAEVATGVLHNVGNVLNSVNVSATVVADRMRDSKTSSLDKVSALLQSHTSDLAAFLTEDPKGRKVPDYLASLAAALKAEQASVVEELGYLRKNIEHIKDIVSMQQSYAKVSGVAEMVAVTDLVEDAIRMNASALTRHEVEVARDFQAQPVIRVEQHKVLQILVNLIRNAKYACDEANRPDKKLILRITEEADGVKISVIDNGIGIAPENLARIFGHGFTTRKDGHGFGLHSGALAAKELGGSLQVTSDGPGRGACFVLILPRVEEGDRT